MSTPKQGAFPIPLPPGVSFPPGVDPETFMIKEVSALNPKTKIEVVMYGRGLDLVVSGKTTLEDCRSD